MLTIEELAKRLDVHVDIARRAAENLLAKGLIEEMPQAADATTEQEESHG